jgi:hypothetical protein
VPDLEERLTRFEARMETLLIQLETRMTDGFAAVDRRLDHINRRFDDVHKRFDDAHARLSGLEGRMGSLEGHIDTRLMGIEGRITVLEQCLDRKASNGELRFWAAWLTGLIGAALALIKL